MQKTEESKKTNTQHVHKPGTCIIPGVILLLLLYVQKNAQRRTTQHRQTKGKAPHGTAPHCAALHCAAELYIAGLT